MALPPKDFHFPSRAQESVDSPITEHGKARKASRFLKADAVPSVFFFFARNLKSPCGGLQWNERGLRCRERHGPERKRTVDSRWPNDENTLYRKLAEHESLQRKRSKVHEGSGDIERPTWRDVGQHAVCIQTGLQKKKNKAILVGLRSCRWEVWGITSRRGREKKKK